MLKAIDMIHRAKRLKSENTNVLVDVHPSRPDYRGFALGDKIVSFEADPSFSEITSRGAILNKNDKTHAVLDDMFLVSGEIPRETSYENGVKFGMRFDQSENEWISDEKIADERFLMCNLKGMLPHICNLLLSNACKWLTYNRQGNNRLYWVQSRRRSQYIAICQQIAEQQRR